MIFYLSGIIQRRKKKTSKTWQQKKSNNSRSLQYMTEETSNDKESMPDLFYRENESEFEVEADDSKYDSEGDEDSDEEINK